MPTTAAASGPSPPNRKVNLFDPADNIDLRDRDPAVQPRPMAPRDQPYVWAAYHAAMLFKDGKGPV